MLTDQIQVGTKILSLTDRTSGPSGSSIRSVTAIDPSYTGSPSVRLAFTVGQTPTREGLRTLIRLDEAHTPSSPTGSLPKKGAVQVVLIQSPDFPSAFASGQPALSVMAERLLRTIASLGGADEIANDTVSTNAEGWSALFTCIQAGLVRVLNGED